MTTVERPRTISLDALLDEYQHLRSYGIGNNEIMERLGTTWEAFMARLRRNGIAFETLTPNGKRNQAILDRLIASGATFHSEALPAGDDDQSNNRLINSAAKAGRIRKVGRRNGQNGSYIALWQGVTNGDNA